MCGSRASGRVQAAEHAERMETQGQQMHGALEQLRQERDAAAEERDTVVRERDAALQRSEDMLGDLKALLAKNQVLRASVPAAGAVVVAAPTSSVFLWEEPLCVDLGCHSFVIVYVLVNAYE